MQATDPDPDPAELVRLEASLLTIVRTAIHRSASLAELPQVGRTGYLVLVTLEQSGQLRLSDLATSLGLDTSTTSRQVRMLEELGLVGRTPDPDDRRAALLSLTGIGTDALHRLRSQRHAVLQEAIRGWPPGHLSQLVELLELLLAGISGTPSTPTPSTPTSTTPASTTAPSTTDREVFA